MANYTKKSNVERALATLLPALKTYVDDQTTGVAATISTMEAMKTVLTEEIPWAGPFMEAVPYLKEGDIIPSSVRLKLIKLPYFEGARISGTWWTLDGCPLLEEVGEGYDFSSCCGQKLFHQDGALKRVPQSLFDTCRPTDLFRAFYECTSLTEFNAPEGWYATVRNMEAAFQGDTGLVTMGVMDTSAAENLNYVFKNCSNLEKVESIDASSALKVSVPFHNCPVLKHALIRNIGKPEAFNHPLQGYDFSIQPVLIHGSNEWGTGSEEALTSLRDTFSTALFDRVAAGYDAAYIVLRKEIGARLTADDIAMANAKGFTMIFAPVDWVIVNKDTRMPVNYSNVEVSGCEIHRAVNDPVVTSEASLQEEGAE